MLRKFGLLVLCLCFGVLFSVGVAAAQDPIHLSANWMKRPAGTDGPDDPGNAVLVEHSSGQYFTVIYWEFEFGVIPPGTTVDTPVGSEQYRAVFEELIGFSIPEPDMASGTFPWPEPIYRRMGETEWLPGWQIKDGVVAPWHVTLVKNLTRQSSTSLVRVYFERTAGGLVAPCVAAGVVGIHTGDVNNN